MLTWAKAVALLPLPSMIGGAALGATQPDGRDARIREASQLLRALPLRFEPNRGQLPGSSEFVARGPGYVIGLEKSGSVLQLAGADSGPTAKVRTRFLHATPGVRLAALDPLPGKTNYLTGNQPDRWVTELPACGKVAYQSVWPGIDLMFYGNGRQLEYDFVVKAGADPSRIEFAVEGADRTTLDAAGNLVLATSGGDVRWLRPVVYQETVDGRKPVEGAYQLTGKNRVAFRVALYDSTKPLVIDPVLSYSTYVGGESNDSSRSIQVDSAGNVYIAGATTSKRLPVTSSSYQAAYGGESLNFFTGDAFVAKINPSGSGLIYLTYLGGSQDDAGLGLAIDDAGNAYVTGFTNSLNFPTTAGAYRTTFEGKGGNPIQPGGDAFVTKLNPQGSALIYSTYLGGNQDEWGLAIGIDSAGNAYVGGVTLSLNFPVTAGVLQGSYKGGGGNPIFDPQLNSPLFAGGDAFLAKLNPTGTALIYGTYLGGSKDDILTSLTVDGSGNVYVAGATQSADFPVSSAAYQKTFGGVANDAYQPVLKLGDGFVAKVNPTATALVYSTLIGGNRDDGVFSIAVDSSGAAYLTGTTSSTNFPITGSAIQKTYTGPVNPTASAAQLTFFYGDAFVAKLNPAGSALMYSTYLGGAGDDAGWAIRVDSSGNAYVAGQTNSADFPTTATALQKTYGGAGGQSQPIGDAFLLKLNAAGDKLTYSSYLGGNQDDVGAGLAIDSAGNAYITGAALSRNFPVTSSALQKAFAGSGQYAEPYGDAFVAKVTELPGAEPAISIAAVVNGASFVSGPVAPGEIVTIFGKGLGPATIAYGDFSGPDQTLQTAVSGARILFDGFPAPVIYTLEGQASVIVPYDIANRTTTQVTAEYNGNTSAAVTLNVAPSSPGMFTVNQSGTGAGIVYNHDNTLNSPTNPEKPGEIIVIYGTGEGQTVPQGVNGKIAAPPYPQFALPVSVTVDDKPSPEIQYYGGVPGTVAGVFQVNARVPLDITTAGPKKIAVKIGTGSTQDNVTVYIQP